MNSLLDDLSNSFFSASTDKPAEYHEHSYLVTSNWVNLLTIEKGCELQTRALQELNHHQATVIGCEHFEVLSAGRSLWNTDLDYWLKDFQNIHKTSRGGKLTLHNPGQLVIYPILNIKFLKLSLKDYVKLLLDVSQTCFDTYGLKSQTDSCKQVGVYFNNKKIASVGLNYSKGWVSHGISLNIKNDLAKFKKFDICGQKEMNVTSLQNEGVSTTTCEFFETWFSNFNKKITSI